MKISQRYRGVPEAWLIFKAQGNKSGTPSHGTHLRSLKAVVYACNVCLTKRALVAGHPSLHCELFDLFDSYAGAYFPAQIGCRAEMSS